MANPLGATLIKNVIEGDLFLKDINLYTKINICGAFWSSMTYGSVVYAIDDSLKNFLTENSKRLSNMNIEYFYRGGVSLVENFCSVNNPKRLAIGLREAGIIHNFMKIGDVTESCFLDGEFLDIYRKLKSNDPSVSGYDVHKKVSFLYEESTQLFFKEFKPDYDIFN